MSTPGHLTPRHQRPHSAPMKGPYLEFNLDQEVQQLHDEDAWRGGRNSRTLAKYDDVRVVLMALKAGVRIDEHKADGRIAIQTLAGHISVHASGRTFDLPVGRLLMLDRATVHNVEALEESAVLLTIAWSEKDKSQRVPAADPRPALPRAR